ncbi:MAG: fused protease/ribonucleoside-triphosphate reductase, partial [Nanoarchaeota archaeon]
KRENYGWTSNNSVFGELGMDYTEVCERIKDNGEPGVAWLENMKGYSRMKNGKDNKDHRVSGGNPCLEQSLESYEVCCLVETFPNNHESLEDFITTLKYAYLYAKTVTLGKTHWPETNRVMLRNRRIGCSISGIAQFITNRGINKLREWCEEGYSSIEKYDEVYSDWLAIPKSIKKTSVKPSGSVSLLVGATPGVHYPESRFYIRRMRLSKDSELIPVLKESGYHLEICFGSEETTLVVEIPIDMGEGIRTVEDISMWEQLSLAAFMQKYWADNQVSCTVTFKQEEKEQIKFALNYFQYQLKGISFLPRTEKGTYKQMPYEKISEEQYNKLVKNLKPLKFKRIHNEEAEIDRFCSNDVCIIK